MQNLVGEILLNRYRVDDLIGRGGMAEVYKVWDQQRAVYLAMKLLREDMAEDKVFLRRFKREAQTLAKLQHPHIVKFYGLEQDGALAFMLLDYIEGHSLRREIFDAPGPLPFSRISQIMKPVCSALHYAHNMGMVHCDLKPGNVMIHKNGSVLVTDFGIARMTDSATATMVGAGTPAYMAPEQARGLDPTPQTDIYALGVVLFEMLTGGERPFVGEQATVTGSTSEKVRWEQINLNPPSPRRWNADISNELEQVVFKSLDKNHENRFPSALELFNSLELALPKHDQPIELVRDVAKSNSEEGLVSSDNAVKPTTPNTDTKNRSRRLIFIFGGILGLIIIVFSVLFAGQQGNIHLALVATRTASPTISTLSPTNTLSWTPEPTGTLTKTLEPTQTYTPTSEPTRTYSPTPRPTRTSTRTPKPTITSTFTPTFTKTPIPATPTMVPPAIVLNYMDGIVITKLDNFDSGRNWDLWVGSVSGGELKITGNNWNGLAKKGKISEGKGIIIDFKFEKNSEFELMFDYGKWATDPYRRFGIYFYSSYPRSNLWLGKNGLGFNNLHGNFQPKADTWYSLCMAVSEGGEFLALIWDPSDPTQIFSYNEKAGEKWASRSWDFRIGANEGIIVFDNFMEFKFDEMK